MKYTLHNEVKYLQNTACHKSYHSMVQVEVTNVKCFKGLHNKTIGQRINIKRYAGKPNL